MQTTSRELATILAALRMWQRLGVGQECEEQDIATVGGEIKPLHDHDIDDLCERLNAEPAAAPWHLFIVQDGESTLLLSGQSESQERAEELVMAAAIDEHNFDAETCGADYVCIVDGDVCELVSQV